MSLLTRIMLTVCYVGLFSGCAGSNTVASVPDPNVMTQQDVQTQNEAKLEAATRF